MSAAPVLEVENLTVALRTARGMRRAVDGVSFSIGEGEILGVAGESGSGKTITALSLLGLLPIGARTSGSVRFQGASCSGSAASSCARSGASRWPWCPRTRPPRCTLCCGSMSR